MNIITLFEGENPEDIKLGIQVIKSLSLEKEFEEYFRCTPDNYQKVFNSHIKFYSYSQKFLYLKHRGRTTIKKLNSKSDTLKIGLAFTQNKEISFIFSQNGIEVNLSEHYELWETLRDKQMDIKDMIETINNYFNERI